MQISLVKVLKQIMAGYNVPVIVIKHIQDLEDVPYLKYRSAFIFDKDIQQEMQQILKSVLANTVYVIEDFLGIQHLYFYLQETKQYCIIGPFRTTASLKKDIEIFKGIDVSNETVEEMKNYYGNVPLVDEQIIHMSIIPILATAFSKERLEVKKIKESKPNSIIPSPMLFEKKEKTLEETMDRIEKRYEVEKELLDAVKNGDLAKAMYLTSKMQSREMIERFFGSLRLQKNSLIVYNTLLRKSIEKGRVHPYYIDEISARYSRQIELLNDDDDYFAFANRMISDYCSYVHKYSLNNYSSLVKIIIHYININLENDLSLHIIADYVNMNASYISNVFKQEVGVTLTDYIHHQRVQMAKELLRETNYSISFIAERVGIYDENYFSRIFKKISGYSPRAYRNRYLK
ncbi:MAG: helix-turn-helix domain-containing protein [Erysipelotrichaceae bacterium]|nr:helix-turn-helix domain-containing protein [Erysipelotrichaceae bacterium]